MQEPSTLLCLKHGVQSSGLGVRQGPGSLAYPSCGRVGGLTQEGHFPSLGLCFLLVQCWGKQRNSLVLHLFIQQS